MQLASEPTGTESFAGYGEVAEYFDRYVGDADAWARKTEPYHRLIRSIYGSLIPRGPKVLEIGCGRGDLLASLEPS